LGQALGLEKVIGNRRKPIIFPDRAPASSSLMTYPQLYGRGAPARRRWSPHKTLQRLSYGRREQGAQLFAIV